MKKHFLLGLLFGLCSLTFVLGQGISPLPKNATTQVGWHEDIILVKTRTTFQSYVQLFDNKQQRSIALRADQWSNILLRADASYCKKAFPHIQGTLIDNILEIKISKPELLESTIAELQKLPFVQYAEKNPVYYTNTLPIPNDTRMNDQYAMRLTRAIQATSVFTGTATPWVAIIDDGLLITHSDLAANMWVNPNEIAGNGIDDDNNGYIDDINGWDAADGDSNANPPSSIAGPNQFSHGTHCAGITGAVTNNNIGIAAISHNQLKLIAVKATRDNISPPYTAITNALQGVEYVVALKQRNPNRDIVASMSFGGAGSSQVFQDLVNTGTNAGILFIAAAGNAGNETISYPCAYENVMCVANTNENDVRNSTSQFGSWVDISAPGTNILSTVALNNTTPTGTYTNYSGTSMSTPMVAGLAALIWAQDASLTPLQVENIIKTTADDIYAVNSGLIGKLGTGRINALNALLKVRGFDNIIPSVITDLALVPNTLNATRASVTWTAPSLNGNFAASAYELRISQNPITQANFSSANIVSPQPIPSLQGQADRYDFTNLIPQTTYYVAVRARSVNGIFSNISNVLQFTTLPSSAIQVNPTNLTTTINLDNTETATLVAQVQNVGAASSLLSYTTSLNASPGKIKARMFFDRGDVDNASDSGIGLTGGGGFLSAMRFRTGNEAFVLTHVQNFIRNNSSVDANVQVSIITGNSASIAEGGVLMTTQTNRLSLVSPGTMFTISLNEPQTIPANTTFWVVFSLPNGLSFPQGFDNIAPSPNTSFISTDGGSSYADVQTLSSAFSTAIFKIRAISGVTWLTLSASTTANNIAASQATNLNLNFNATELLPGTYTANILFNNNSLGQPILNRSVTLIVTGGKPIINLPEANPTAAGVVCQGAEFNIPIRNLGKATLVISSVSFENLVGVNSTNVSVISILPLSIAAESQAGLTIRVIRDTPLSSFSGVVRITSNDTQAGIVSVPFTGSVAALQITQVSNFLVANANTGLQWFIGQDALSNARSASYTPTLTGDYKVVMTVGNCTATSNTIRFVVTDLENSITANSKVQIFPNPTQDELQIRYRMDSPNPSIVLNLYNAQGKLILQKQLPNNQDIIDETLNLKALPQGLYLVQMIDGKQTFTQKIVKE